MNSGGIIGTFKLEFPLQLFWLEKIVLRSPTNKQLSYQRKNHETQPTPISSHFHPPDFLQRTDL